MKTIDLGYDSFVLIEKVEYVASFRGSALKRTRAALKNSPGKYVDLTQGHATLSLVGLQNGTICACATDVGTLRKRIEKAE